MGEVLLPGSLPTPDFQVNWEKSGQLPTFSGHRVPILEVVLKSPLLMTQGLHILVSGGH